MRYKLVHGKIICFFYKTRFIIVSNQLFLLIGNTCIILCQNIKALLI